MNISEDIHVVLTVDLFWLLKKYCARIANKCDMNRAVCVSVLVSRVDKVAHRYSYPGHRNGQRSKINVRDDAVFT